MSTTKQEEKRTKSFMIANPMYDTVFKRLMENDRVVKFFIGTLLEEEVLSVDIRFKGNIFLLPACPAVI
jgi:hypothetical protein